MTIPAFTSTASKRPEALYGSRAGGPIRMRRAAGCRVWDADGNEYLDTMMALGAVALGYAHPGVTAAVERAARDGVVGPLAPVLEAEVAERLAAVLPGVEATLFFKTGAEAVAAAVRIARTATGRERVITCGYHGWLDWCQDGAGVPAAVRALRREVPFSDVPALEAALDAHGPVAAVVLEPVIEREPDVAWLRAARDLTTRRGAVLVFDEVKTAFRIATGGAAERYGVTPDLLVVGKALGNGLPLAAVGGPRALMEAAARTWISSTLATEQVSLAAARAVLDAYERDLVPASLERAGTILLDGLARLAARYPDIAVGTRGIPQMCFLAWRDDEVSAAAAVAAARHGVLFKRSAYNFVSLAHTDEVLRDVLERLDGALAEVTSSC